MRQLAGEQFRSLRVERGRRDVGSVREDRVARRRTQPFRVLIHQRPAPAELPDLLKEGGERSVGGTVVDLRLVEPHPETGSTIDGELAARERRVEGGEECEVRYQPIAGRSPAGADQYYRATIHRRPNVIGARRIAEEGGGGRREVQPVDQVRDRRNGL